MIQDLVEDLGSLALSEELVRNGGAIAGSNTSASQRAAATLPGSARPACCSISAR